VRLERQYWLLACYIHVFLFMNKNHLIVVSFIVDAVDVPRNDTPRRNLCCYPHAPIWAIAWTDSASL
jgi:hypothetical protein